MRAGGRALCGRAGSRGGGGGGGGSNTQQHTNNTPNINHSIPPSIEDLQCPISLELLSEGVVCEDGYTYQARARFFCLF